MHRVGRVNFSDESSQKEVAFLDVNVSLENGCITNDLYAKSTDCHQYLHCSSAHPDHLKNSIIYSQALRLINICTYERDFQEACTIYEIMVFREEILKGND